MASAFDDGRRFDDPAWLAERKLDGIRLLAFRDSGDVWLLSRTQHVQSIPLVEEAVRSQPSTNFVLDGEYVGGVLCVFDVPRLDGREIEQLTLTERKALLFERFEESDALRLVGEEPGTLTAAYERACREGWEGVIVKRRDSTYQHRRSNDWRKWKCELAQEFVVGGWTDPQGARVGLGALLVGYYEDGDLVFAGKVGTGQGFSAQMLTDLRARLHEIEECPFTRGVGLPRLRQHWARPEVVVQVGFTEWTVNGKLRHPRFLRLRTDKAPRDVVREG